MIKNYNQAEKLNSEFFNKSCEKFGNISWKACCYLDEFMQPVYYNSILKKLNNVKSLLDVGCGQGDLFEFLKINKIDLKYKGIDVSEKMVSFAKNKHKNDLFENISLLDMDQNNTFDAVLCIGAFNLKVFKKQEQIDYLKKSVEKLYLLSNRVCCFTLLSKHGCEYLKNEKDLFYYEPWEVLEYCLNLTSSVTLDHASIPIEFIVTLYKDS
jgi:SAM-dependent methyltransferase